MKKSTKQAMGAGALATSMAAVAAAYYLYGAKDAKQNRKKVASWATKAEKEIVREAKRLKKAAYTDANINRIISAVAERYEVADDLDAADVRRFMVSMKKQWGATGKTLQARAKKVVKKKRS